MSDKITLHVEEPHPITLNYVEAKIKPEVVGHATPTEQAQTVTPAPGTTFSAVEVDAIPPEYVVPSGTLDITENAEDINVRDKAAVNVNVQPNLQTPDPITPTEQQQIITPGAGYDGLTQAVVEPIPSEYIVPSGTLLITTDGDYNVSQIETAEVKTAPTKGFVFGGWTDGGKPTWARIVGFDDIENTFFASFFSTAITNELQTLSFDPTVTRLRDYSIRYCYVPTVIFEGECPYMGNGAFNNNRTRLFDFSNATRLPANAINTLQISIDYCPTFRIPYALSDEYLGEGNGWQSFWSAFPTDTSLSKYVVWEVVRND